MSTRVRSAATVQRAENAGLARLYSLPGHLIRRCHQISVALFHEECARFDITPMQYAVLAVLAAHDGVDQITAAGLAALNRSTAGEVVARLEAAKQLERFDSDDDGRVKKLYITRSGLRLLERVDDAIQRVQERLLAPLDQAERARFVDFLSRIACENFKLSWAPLRHFR
jgi:DNA-binding MarR family transcriptional regulator